MRTPRVTYLPLGAQRARRVALANGALRAAAFAIAVRDAEQRRAEIDTRPVGWSPVGPRRNYSAHEEA